MNATRAEEKRQALIWLKLRTKVAWLNFSDWFTGRAVIGNCPVVVSLTTHGTRLATVHTSIQSIVAANVRPTRLILWLNGDPDSRTLTPQLERLQRRGLEIRYAPNFGPHTKYFPYVTQFAEEGKPLVTADDDVIYPKDWLEGLMAAHQSAPNLIHCYWARKLTLENGQVLPYLAWENVSSQEPSTTHFALGVSGVIYPPRFLLALRDGGDLFAVSCPRADDVWLHAMAVRNGYRISQVKVKHVYPRLVPFTQDAALYHANHLPGGNDAQIAATYTHGDLELLTK
ncbi:MAG: hypothetical protein Q7U13_04475 [Rhodoferax sp.]|nr:hypothetical protein [Rhodoferax sp.]